MENKDNKSKIYHEKQTIFNDFKSSLYEIEERIRQKYAEEKEMPITQELIDYAFDKGIQISGECYLDFKPYTSIPEGFNPTANMSKEEIEQIFKLAEIETNRFILKCQIDEYLLGYRPYGIINMIKKILKQMLWTKKR